jgi:hypothetical protein
MGDMLYQSKTYGDPAVTETAYTTGGYEGNLGVGLSVPDAVGSGKITFEHGNTFVEAKGRKDLENGNFVEAFIKLKDPFGPGEQDGRLHESPYVQFGNATLNHKIGNIEGDGIWNIAGDPYKAEAGIAGIYEGNDLGRKDGYALGYSAGDLGLQLFVAWDPGDELATDADADADGVADTAASNLMGLRPVVSFATGGMTIKAVLENISTSAQNGEISASKTFTGFGVGVNADLGGMSAGGNFTSGSGATGDGTNDLEKVTKTGISAFVKMPMGADTLGVTLNTGTVDTSVPADADPTKDSETRIFGFYEHPKLSGVDGATLWFAFGQASYSTTPPGGDAANTSVLGLKIRAKYEF